MIRYVQGFTVVQLSILLIAVVSDIAARRAPVATWTELALTLVLLPLVVVGGTAIVVTAVRPRRVLDRARSAAAPAVVLGMVTGILAVTGTAALLMLLDGAIYDVMMHIPASCASTVVALMFFGGRRQPGSCVACGYDIAASLDFGRCPECGRGLCGTSTT